MKLTVTATSENLYEKILAEHGAEALALIEAKRIKGGVIGELGIEIQHVGTDVYVETVLDTAVVAECRLISEDTGPFAFNTDSLAGINIVAGGEGSFTISIV